MFLSLKFSLSQIYKKRLAVESQISDKSYFYIILRILNIDTHVYVYVHYEYAIARTQITYVTYEESRQELGGRRDTS